MGSHDQVLTWTKDSPEKVEERKRLYAAPSVTHFLAKSSPYNIVLSQGMIQHLEEIKNFELRPDDIWIVTYPKCGTTWTQEMIWQIVNNVDIEGGKVPLPLRSPFLESCGLAPPGMSPEQAPPEAAEIFKQLGQSIEITKSLQSPRVIKTHLPMSLLNPKILEVCKVVYVARNPKDCCVSFYHHERTVPLHNYIGSFEEFAEHFKNGDLLFGNYWFHLKDAWQYKNNPNMKFIWFEDMKKDLQKIIRELCSHLGYHLTDWKVLQLDDHLYIDNFRKNSAVNPIVNEKGSFIRKGKVGDWKNYFTEEKNNEWMEWIQENIKGTDIQFKFNL